MAAISDLSVDAIGGFIQEGLDSAEASDALLASGVVKIAPDAVFTGSNVNFAIGNALAAPTVADYLDDARDAPQSVADSMLEVAVKTLPMSIRVPNQYIENWKNNRIVSGFSTIEGYIASLMTGQLKATLRAAIISKLDALSGATVVLDVSARSGTAGGLTVASEAIAIIEELLALYGDTDRNLASWIAHSKIARDLSLLMNDAGIRYYPKKQGVLYVEDVPLLKLDTATRNGSGPYTYDTYIAKKDSVLIACNVDPTALASTMQVLQVAQAANLPAGIQIDAEISYAVVLPDKYMGTSKPGVLKLISD